MKLDNTQNRPRAYLSFDTYVIVVLCIWTDYKEQFYFLADRYSTSKKILMKNYILAKGSRLVVVCWGFGIDRLTHIYQDNLWRENLMIAAVVVCNLKSMSNNRQTSYLRRTKSLKSFSRFAVVFAQPIEARF